MAVLSGATGLPTLHVLQGPDKGRTYEALNEPTLIGRSSDQIQLSDDSTSRLHAEIRPGNGAWVLVDLKSANGTFLNGLRITNPTPLKHGDQIKVGSTLLVFSGQDELVGFARAQQAEDLVDLDPDGVAAGSSILSAVDGSEDSVILQAPETADAVAAWNVVYKVAEMVGTVDSADILLERVVDIMFAHLIVDHLVLLLYDPERKHLKPRAVRYRARPRVAPPKIVASQTIMQHVVEKKEGVLCANAMTDDRFSGDNLQDSIHRLGLRSVICVPILAHHEVHGVFHLDCSMSYHTYTHEQLRLAVAIGRLAGMALENTRLLETRMRTARLAAAGETVANLSHHIRNLLQGMQGGADVLELGLRRENLETAESGWALVRSNLDRVYHLTLNMLTFSKERQPRIEPAALNPIIEDVITLAQKRADEKGVILLPELGEIPIIPLDPDGIHQVAHNILLNAIEAAPADGGRVNIRTAAPSEATGVVLSITDDGAGIPEDQRELIFDAFHSSRGHGGTGLGLAAAKKIVNELQGRIEVESTLGKGTTFHIYLPASDSPLTEPDATVAPA